MNSVEPLRNALYSETNVLPGEDAALYERIRSELVERYRPQSLLDDWEVQALLDTMWEVMRLSRAKPQILSIDRKRALVRLVQTTLMSPTIVKADEMEKSNRLACAYFTDENERK